MSNLQKSHFAVKEDRSDWRDLPYNFARVPLRDNVDLRQWASAVEEQYNIGSCTSQAIIGAYELLIRKNFPEKYVDLSRLFVYYNGREIENIITEDAGIYVRDGLKAIRNNGICAESLWPYDAKLFSTRPSEECYADARSRNIKNYRRLSSLDDILDAVNADCPVVFSMEVFGDFRRLEMHPGDCILKMPESDEIPVGGHAMLVVGYDLDKKLLLVRNSFGKDWCMDGYCWIPFNYARSHFIDRWIFDVDLI